MWGAEDDRAARRIAFSIANSPIVKTAIAGEDPNWGRVVMAVGKSGEAADRDKLSIWFGEHIVARNGERAEEYVEKTVAEYMKNGELDDPRRRRHRRRRGDGLDLRPHPRLRHDQLGLSQLIEPPR